MYSKLRAKTKKNVVSKTACNTIIYHTVHFHKCIEYRFDVSILFHRHVIWWKAIVHLRIAGCTVSPKYSIYFVSLFCFFCLFQTKIPYFVSFIRSFRTLFSPIAFSSSSSSSSCLSLLCVSESVFFLAQNGCKQ